jgi:hypothetical protein
MQRQHLHHCLRYVKRDHKLDIRADRLHTVLTETGSIDRKHKPFEKRSRNEVVKLESNNEIDNLAIVAWAQILHPSFGLLARCSLCSPPADEEVCCLSESFHHI